MDRSYLRLSTWAAAVLIAGILASTAVHADTSKQALDRCVQSKDLKAKVRFCTLIIEDPNFDKLDGTVRALIFKSRGDGYFLRHEYARAIADYDGAISLDGQNSSYWNNRASALYEQAVDLDDQKKPDDAKRNLDKALADTEQALALDPKNANAHYNRGLALHRKSDFKGAIAAHTEAIRLRPNYAEAYFARGQSYGASRNNKEAIADFRAVLRLNPRHKEARELIELLKDF